MSKQTFNVGGLDQLMRNMNTLKDKTIKKATRAGINAGLTPLVKTIKHEIDNVSSDQASTSLKRAAKKTIGKRLKKRRGKYHGKAGFAVGKPTKRRKFTARERYQAGWGGMKILSGVGISASNIHWFVLGTASRFRRKGATGKIKPVFHGIIPMAAISSSGKVAEATKKKTSEVIEREARKMRT